MTKTKLVYAVDMLHYLPLYIAHKRYLADEFDVELAPAPQGDKAAMDRLMSTLSEDESVKFCVCDPMMVNLPESLNATSADKPVVIAQLIRRVPFWAVDHQMHSFKEEEHFSQFTQIFAYPSPNTGYVFGKLMLDAARKHKPKGTEIREKPIDADLDLYLKSDSAVVIEADILKIRKFQEATRGRIVFSFPRSVRCRRFCFTALLTTKNFLQSPGGKAAAGRLLHALQKALYLVHNDYELTLKYATDHFSGKGFDEAVIDGALKELIEESVFPRCLLVGYRDWQASIQVRRLVDGSFRYPPYRQFVDNTIASKEYEEHLTAQTEKGMYWLVRNSFDLPTVRPFLEGAFFLGVAALPFAIFGITSLRTHPAKVWVTANAALTVLLAALYYFRGWITAHLRLDPANATIHALSALFAYVLWEIEVYMRLAEATSGH